MLALGVVLTGPESTGKTTLAERLAQAHDVPWSAEHARVYAETRPGVALGAHDVEPIARGQIVIEDVARAEATRQGRPIVVHDTDLVSTVVYARHYYGACPRWIEDAARTRRSALYLLCVPDVPWVTDATRDRPAARDALLAEFRGVLDELGCPTVEIRGAWAEREAAAQRAVDALLRTPND